MFHYNSSKLSFIYLSIQEIICVMQNLMLAMQGQNLSRKITVIFFFLQKIGFDISFNFQKQSVKNAIPIFWQKI